ncbi:hypothetical protein ACI48D_08360 [Massilia sp. LXY-6]|uniref:hypothetical protein n=1 Tax=Massilia sp. LXY-6 TaxID=3379823 RepID=UPI003EDF9C88
MMTPYIRRHRLERLTLTAAFLALFPGFFFYHFLLGTGRIRAFLGGYFSPVSLAFALPILVLYVRQFRKKRSHLLPTELYYGGFLAFVVVVVVVNGVNGANQLIVVAHLFGVLYMANTFVMFKMLDFAHPEVRYPAILCLLGMSAVIFSFSVDGVFRMDAMGLALDPSALSTYQGLARSYLVNCLCVVAFTRSLPLRVFLYIIGVISLFLNTARSEFVALLFAIPFIEFYFAKHKVLFAMVLALLATLITMHIDLLLSMMPDNRIMELLDLSHSTSAIARRHLAELAIRTISSYPIFGDYASYAPGHYAHNILSAWVDLGIFGFLYLIALLVFPTVAMIICGYFSKNDDGDLVLGFAMACVTILLLIKSHFYTDMLIGAMLGAYSRYKLKGKYPMARTTDLNPPSTQAQLDQVVPRQSG